LGNSADNTSPAKPSATVSSFTANMKCIFPRNPAGGLQRNLTVTVSMHVHLPPIIYLGCISEPMTGVPEGFDETQKTVYESALSGNAEAMFLVASFYHNGDNVERSDEKAFEWCLKAAEAGNANAMNNLGTMYATGDGVKQSMQDAARWFRAAAEEGLADAQYNLALMYENGIGVEANPNEAGKWLYRASEQGYEPALQHMSSFYKH